MKVLHVIPSLSERSGGPGQAIISMCRSLQEQGTEVLIATTDHDQVSSSEKEVSSSRVQVPKLQSPDSSACANGRLASPSLTRSLKPETRNHKGVPTLFFPLGWGESFKYSKPLSAWLDGNVKNFDVVHIHAVFNHASIAAANACRKNSVPYVVRPLGTLDPWSMKQKPLRKQLFWRLAGKRMLAGAAAVHYTARAEQSAAEASLGLNHGIIIPLSVDIDPSTGVNGVKKLSTKLQGLSAGRYVLVLSRLHPKKGLAVLIEAFLKLTQTSQFQDWKLVLAGDGQSDDVKVLKDLVAKSDAQESVLFPGWLEGDEKDAFLRNAALLALPSYHENFGLCVMEALAHGVPVLVSPHVSLADEVSEAGAGWITAVDKGAIETALREALANEAERTRRGRAGRELSTAFSSERVVTQLTEMYVEVSAAQR